MQQQGHAELLIRALADALEARNETGNAHLHPRDEMRFVRVLRSFLDEECGAGKAMAKLAKRHLKADAAARTALRDRRYGGQ